MSSRVASREIGEFEAGLTPEQRERYDQVQAIQREILRCRVARAKTPSYMYPDQHSVLTTELGGLVERFSGLTGIPAERKWGLVKQQDFVDRLDKERMHRTSSVVLHYQRQYDYFVASAGVQSLRQSEAARIQRSIIASS